MKRALRVRGTPFHPLRAGVQVGTVRKTAVLAKKAPKNAIPARKTTGFEGVLFTDWYMGNFVMLLIMCGLLPCRPRSGRRIRGQGGRGYGFWRKPSLSGPLFAARLIRTGIGLACVLSQGVQKRAFGTRAVRMRREMAVFPTFGFR